MNAARVYLLALALASLFLSRRSPSYRPLSASLLLLAAIDVARLVTAPHAALREWGWWQADVMLCALWPVAIGVGLAQKARPAIADGPRTPSAHGGRATPIIPRLVAICSLAILLGALRSYLPRVVYLTGLRLPRWALAGLWVEVLVSAWMACKDEGPRPKPEPFACDAGVGSPTVAHNLNPRGADPPPRFGAGGTASRGSIRTVGPRVPMPPTERGGEQDKASSAIAQDFATLACSLILAATNTADLLAGAWDVAPWEAPQWAYARACTWAAYVGVGVVMGWEAVRRGRTRGTWR